MTDPVHPPKHTNRLAQESSPYLLQHAHNPVHWHPWGPEAFEIARQENKPIFLSVGYSTCYWCHVMERQCFENEAVAAEMNQRFVNIKVDREERPDVDQLYMTAVQVLTRHGGWPMSVFLTPDLRPFYGGTYFPPTDMHGRPGFVSILRGLDDAYHNRPGDVKTTADRLVNILGQYAEPSAPDSPVLMDDAFIEGLVRRSVSDYDPKAGGFGGAPKFPRETLLELLLVYTQTPAPAPALKSSLKQMLRHTLEALADGGIRDQLGGGFHRYSTDAHWLVPHFEIMLYDNAMLGWCYVEAYRQLRDDRFAAVARGIFDFILREMTAPDGAFYTALDAEVDSQEGLNYLWTATEIEAILGPQDAAIFNKVYGVDAGPNFADPHHGNGVADKSILYFPRPLEEVAEELSSGTGVPPVSSDQANLQPPPRSNISKTDESSDAHETVRNKNPAQLAHDLEARLAPLRQKLYAARMKRKQPLLDTKIITSWNALMIRALAHGGKTLNEPRYIAAAQKAADYLLQSHRTLDGGLYRTSRDGHAKYAGFIDDYAFLIQALLAVADASDDIANAQLRQVAFDVTSSMNRKFADADLGGFYFSEADAKDLILRQKTSSDSPLPSGNAVAAMALLELGQADLAQRALAPFAAAMESHGEGMSSMVQATLMFIRKAGPFQVSSAPTPQPDRPATPQKQASDIMTARIEWRSATELLVHLRISTGFHINAHEVPSDPPLVATTLSVPDEPTVVIEYPAAEELKTEFADLPIPVYSGDVTITVRFSTAKKPGGSLSLNLTYQACNESTCLMPVTRGISA